MEPNPASTAANLDDLTKPPTSMPANLENVMKPPNCLIYHVIVKE